MLLHRIIAKNGLAVIPESRNVDNNYMKLIRFAKLQAQTSHKALPNQRSGYISANEVKVAELKIHGLL